MSKEMKIHTSYTAFIRGQLSDDHLCGPVSSDLMNRTAQLCLSALKFCCGVFLEHWDTLKPLKSLERKTAAEALIHTTKDNVARYPEFDVRFHNLPSGVRRAIRNDALGKVSSYVSNHKNWEALKPSERGAEPTLGLPSRYQLTFYQTERKTEDLKRGRILLKLYNGKTWEWYAFLLKPSDARHLAHMAERHTMLSPIVEKVRGEYRIRFCFEDKRELVSDEDKLSYRILAVDLGINAAATWSVMTADGTVHARGVLHARAEEDRLCHILNRVRKYQRCKRHPKSSYQPPFQMGVGNFEFVVAFPEIQISFAKLNFFPVITNVIMELFITAVHHIVRDFEVALSCSVRIRCDMELCHVFSSLSSPS